MKIMEISVQTKKRTQTNMAKVNKMSTLKIATHGVTKALKVALVA